MFALILAAAPVPQSAPPTLVRMVGHWKIERDARLCYASSGFGSNYALTVGVDRAMLPMLGITSDLWTWSSGTKLDAVFAVGGKNFSGGTTDVFVEDKARTLLTNMPADFLPALRVGKKLDFFDDVDGWDEGDAPRVTLTFTDMGPVVDALVTCTTALPAPKNTGQPPVAPPAPPAPPRPAPSVPASPPTYLNKAEVIRSNDYPKGALKARAQGTTHYRVSVSPTGAPTGCTITTSSGYSVLDARACELIMARARFAPAKDSQGRPIAGTLDARVFWQAP